VTNARGTRESAYNFSAHFRVGQGRTHRIVLTIVYTGTQPVIIISLLMSPLLGQRFSFWVTHKENGP
jgi:hypothetical protein